MASDETERFDTDPTAAALLTLRLATPPGALLPPHDERLFHELLGEVPLEAEEDLLLSMMNLAWYALIRLTETSEVAIDLARRLPEVLEAMPELEALPTTPQAWLQQLLLDLEEARGGG
jgi:hypothetical protein